MNAKRTPPMPVPAYLKPERIQEQLQRVPDWKLSPDGRGIVRTRELRDLVEARAFVDQVCRLSALQCQPVKVRLAGPKVEVTLEGHPVRGCIGGLGVPVFNLAEMIG
ncbi:MAG TPA: 4a-hydroxytetrahydrobiopterin dehydratase [Thermoanaerobaculia bacterium]|nr:4a-hydroxytetrahydrobiopterin dehydratase [Thermoanaerobaculia bacterium]